MILDWILENWHLIVAGYTSLVGLASIIVKLTPTLKDDTILKAWIKFVGKFIALNRK